MLEELHAGDNVECAGGFDRERFRRDAAIVDVRAGFELVQPRNAERLVSEVDAERIGAAFGHRLGQDATAAADVDDALS